MVISVWDNMDGTPSTSKELMDFADEYGLTVPVLADTDGEIRDRFAISDDVMGLEVLLAPGLEVIVGGMMLDEDDIAEALDDGD